MTRSAGRAEVGSVTLWVLLLTMLVVVPMGAIAFDLWHGFSAQRSLASAADAAAAAGANEIDTAAYRQSGTVQIDPALAEQVAAQNLAAQRGLPSIDFRDIHADTTQVTVIIRGRVPLSLLGWFNHGPLEVTASSTGRAHARR